MEITPIAHIRNDFPAKFGIPHQSGRLESLRADIVFEPEYRTVEAFRGLESFTHIWLLWEFSETVIEKWSPTVRPPRLGGNTRMGVFATRSPFRPNPLGLSSVKLLSVSLHTGEGPVLHVAGADLMDGTPVYDIKPYIGSDCHPDARYGFTEAIKEHKLSVSFPAEQLSLIPEGKREALLDVLADDPRPGYQKDPERVYGMPFGEWDVHFKVEGSILTVCSVDVLKKRLDKKTENT